MHPHFAPIAIIGRACLVPGANDPEALWRNVLAGLDSVASAPPGAWRLEPATMAGPTAPATDRVAHDRGGYVTGVAFDPHGFRVPAEELIGLDPLVHWLLHTGRNALGDTGAAWESRVGARAGAIFGNLSYPSFEAARFAEDLLTQPQEPPPDPRNRFGSGLPAHILARALGLGAGAFALDAACASSLYAIKLACDWLHDGRADLMLAGAVNRADNLFLHAGFAALGAISPSGRSRPFHRDADGLLPAEGAGFVVLKRLEDARAAGDRILGVIRGVGLSNDGRGAGLLVPSEKGQEAAIRRAYEMAGLWPGDVSLLECHATGTAVGDGAEIRSTGRVFSDWRDVPLGSLKSNLGHLITVAGVAGLIKILGAIEHAIRPPTLHADEPLEALAKSPFRLLRSAEPWAGPRRAAVSAFGFGGNNAHLIVEAPDLGARAVHAPRPRRQIAIVSVGVVAGDRPGTEPFVATLLSGESRARPAAEVVLPVASLKFPPQDLRRSLGQQLMMMQAAEEALADAPALPHARTSVIVGMGVDLEAARFNVRWRRAGQVPDAELIQARDAISPPLVAASVLGAMPNLPANRLTSALDLRGPSFTVSAEELSGLTALDLAARALAAGEIDAALVGAVDLSCEPMHEAAARALLPTNHQLPGDAAVALVLRRLEDAERAGETVLAILGDEFPAAPRDLADLTPLFGHAHAASGLLHVAAAALALRERAIVQPGAPATPWAPASNPRALAIHIDALGGAHADLVLVEARARQPRPRSVARDRWPALHVYSGADPESLLAAVSEGRESDVGPARLVILADAEGLAAKRAAAREVIFRRRPVEGMFYRARPIAGELAFVFTMAAAAYPKMGRELFLGMPQLLDDAVTRYHGLARAAAWIYDGDGREPTLTEQLAAYTFMTQAHVSFTRGVLGLSPQAAIGLCTGESASLTGLGAWRDIDALLADIDGSGLYGRELDGDFAAVRRAWNLADGERIDWATWRILRPVAEVRAALASETRAHLAIVHTPSDCLLVGDAAACARVVARVGADHARHLGPGMAIHCPEVGRFAATWRQVHHRHTHAVPGVRFYTHATGEAYTPTADSAADAITAQALTTISFPRVIERAWQDGVRVFVEHGPRGLCTDWIPRILGEREHLAVALDSPSRPLQALAAVAELIAAGIAVNRQALAPARVSDSRKTAAVLTFAAHPPRTEVMKSTNPARMSPAPGVSLEAAIRTGWTFAGPPAPAVTTPAPRVEPRFSRADLEVLASGRISSVFGPLFEQQDQFRRQVRMPEPPLLLADRVTQIEGAAGSMGKGTIWTETDVRAGAWYLHDGAMPAGIMVESGQADLLLISWLGADFTNRGDRIYRLLGCELTFHGPLARPGETLAYEIHVDGHARFGEVRLFFFHYDCMVGAERRLSVRGGQAGFFSDEELASSAGIIWDPTTTPPRADVTLSPPVVSPQRRAYSATQLAAFAAGRLGECFGPGYEAADRHHATPRIQGGAMLLIDEVTEIDPRGGPWGRGYLRAVTHITPERWFFAGHFKDDPCMPGTLMFEGCLQAMSIYLAALGFTLDKDSCHFEPIPEEKVLMRCRGQVTPRSRELVTEIFVEELIGGEHPVLRADLLCTSDGLKGFHCRGMPLGIVPRVGHDVAAKPAHATPAPTTHPAGGKTEVTWDSPFVHDGMATAGAMLDAALAGQRMQFVAGEVSFHGGLVRPGQNLTHDVHVDADSTRPTFYLDSLVGGQPRLSLRAGEASPVTGADLGHPPGIAWDPATEATPPRTTEVARARVTPARASHTADELAAFAAGRPFLCFGPTVAATEAHVATPRIPAGRLLALAEVTQLDPGGGPHRRGYLRARLTPGADRTVGHFLDGALQAMACYLTALGQTLDKDGWRFEPVPDEPMTLRARATPGGEPILEVFIVELTEQPICSLRADVRAILDGKTVFLARGLTLALVRDVPLTRLPPAPRRPDERALVLHGHRFDSEALESSALGWPSRAFGPGKAGFDRRHMARLPNPPLLLVSRYLAADPRLEVGATIEAEYDVPADAWYFAQNGAPVMPLSILMEVALQPCGTLSVLMGCAEAAAGDVAFRNLDGTMTVFHEATPATGTITVKVRTKQLSLSREMIIIGFHGDLSAGEKSLATFESVFGFFPAAALAAQAGLPTTPAERAHLDEPSPFDVDLKTHPARWFAGRLRLPGDKLLMLDRVSGYWPTAGKAGLGRLRAVKNISPGEWFFKAHFYEDPVQPGSLGVEATAQLLECYAIERGLGASLTDPHFEVQAVGKQLTWKYRGQVPPSARQVTVEIEVTEVGTDHAVADAWLWSEGIRIYHVKALTLRVVAGKQARAALAGPRTTATDEITIDLAHEPWLADHRPTHTRPALAMMDIVDRLATAVEAHFRSSQTGQHIVAIEDVKLRRWAVIDGPTRFRRKVEPQGEHAFQVTLEIWRAANDPRLSRFELLVGARVRVASEWPAAPPPLPPLSGGQEVSDSYQSGQLFHGPAFQILQRLVVAGRDLSGVLHAESGVPTSVLNPALLDGITHCIQHDDLAAFPGAPRGAVAYPAAIAWIRFHGPTPASGVVTCETRGGAYDPVTQLIPYRAQLLVDGRVWADIDYTEHPFSMGRIGQLSRADRTAFCRDRQPVAGFGLSDTVGDETRATVAEIARHEWFPHIIADFYGTEGAGRRLAEAVAEKDHIARRLAIHPSHITIADHLAHPDNQPLTVWPLATTWAGDTCIVRDAGPPQLDLAPVDRYVRSHGRDVWPGRDLIIGGLRRFLRRVVLADPAGFAALDGRSVIFLANHQVGIESPAFAAYTSALTGTTATVLAKVEHRQTWVGKLSEAQATYPGVHYPDNVIFFDRQNPAQLLEIFGTLRTALGAKRRSILIHVDGTRSLSCRTPTAKVTQAILDLAVAARLPVVPVRFVGGLPVDAAPERLELPLDGGTQDVHFGRAISPEEIERMPFAERPRHVLAAINNLCDIATEVPNPPDLAFAARVSDWATRTGAGQFESGIVQSLADLPDPSPETLAVLAAAKTGRLEFPSDEPEHKAWLTRFAQWLRCIPT